VYPKVNFIRYCIWRLKIKCLLSSLTC